jgi:hypothetical protein
MLCISGNLEKVNNRVSIVPSLHHLQDAPSTTPETVLILSKPLTFFSSKPECI